MKSLSFALQREGITTSKDVHVVNAKGFLGENTRSTPVLIVR